TSRDSKSLPCGLPVVEHYVIAAGGDARPGIALVADPRRPLAIGCHDPCTCLEVLKGPLHCRRFRVHDQVDARAVCRFERCARRDREGRGAETDRPRTFVDQKLALAGSSWSGSKDSRHVTFAARDLVFLKIEPADP